MKMLLSTIAISTFLLALSHLAAAHDHKGDATPAGKPKTKVEAKDPEFTKLDTDKDGFIKKSELPAKHPLIAHFGMLDKNKDGKLDPQEFKAAKSML